MLSQSLKLKWCHASKMLTGIGKLQSNNVTLTQKLKKLSTLDHIKDAASVSPRIGRAKPSM